LTSALDMPDTRLSYRSWLAAMVACSAMSAPDAWTSAEL
jgi:hypothetical protein